MPQLRVLTWNVRSLKDDRGAVARILRAARPDVVCLQEAPRGSAFARLRLERVTAAAGLRVVGGGRAAGGPALLRAPEVRVTDVQVVRFPLANGQPRGTVVASVTPAGGGPPLRIATMHLGLDEAERLRHTDRLLELLGPGPGVLAGDLNEAPGGPSWRALGHRLRDPAPDAGPTYPARRPRVRIDAILPTEGVTVQDYADWRPDPADAARATDHLPVVATLTY